MINVIIDEAHLLNITVKPENQGRGLGLRLLEHLMQRARELKAGECFLEVRASNESAYRLYERYGFNGSAGAGATTRRSPGVKMPW